LVLAKTMNWPISSFSIQFFLDLLKLLFVLSLKFQDYLVRLRKIRVIRAFEIHIIDNILLFILFGYVVLDLGIVFLAIVVISKRIMYLVNKLIISTVRSEMLWHVIIWTLHLCQRSYLVIL